jgi:hypothetical protein
MSIRRQPRWGRMSDSACKQGRMIDSDYLEGWLTRGLQVVEDWMSLTLYNPHPTEGSLR